MAATFSTRRFAAASIAAILTVTIGSAAFAQSEPAQSANWTQEPGSNRFGVGLNGLGGTHATPMYASRTDITGWGITDMKTRTPSAPMPAEVRPGEHQSLEANGNDLDGLLPPLNQR
jgi:hypothetical protein